MERPTALLTSMHANSQRDPKKQSKPFNYLDFAFYKPVNTGDTPKGHYGASFMELIKRKTVPAWALFCFKELSAGATEGYVPSEPALIAQDAVLLHPEKKGGEWHGMLIAQETASEQYRRFKASNGEEYTLRVPYIETKVIAREGEILTP